jgi:transposase
MEINKTQIVTPRSKNKVSIEAQKELLIKWKASGLSKREFCKMHNIRISTFYGWCKKILPKSNFHKEPSRWSPVITTKRKLLPGEQEQAIIELSLPNHIVARVKVSSHKVVSFIQEICHAAAIIR